ARRLSRRRIKSVDDFNRRKDFLPLVVRKVRDLQPIDLADQHPRQQLRRSWLGECTVRDNRHQSASRRGDFYRLKIAGQGPAPLKLPLTDHTGRQVRLVIIMPRRLGPRRGSQRQPGTGNRKTTSRGTEHDFCRERPLWRSVGGHRSSIPRTATEGGPYSAFTTVVLAAPSPPGFQAEYAADQAGRLACRHTACRIAAP